MDLDVVLVHSANPDKKDKRNKAMPIARIASRAEMQDLAVKKATKAAEAAMSTTAGRSKEKEIRLGSNIADHDLHIKMEKIKELLTRGATVRVVAAHSVRRLAVSAAARLL